MSIGGSYGQSTTKTKGSSTGQADPWDVAIPALQDLIGQTGDLLKNGQGGVTSGQQTAFDELKGNAASAGQFAPQIKTLANDLFSTESQSPMVQDGYADFQRRLNPVADGANLDIMNDPQLAKLLQQVGDDAAGRVNASFAAGGRTGSGANQASVARGVGQAQLPVLVNQLNAEKGRTDAAARDLFTGSGTAAGSIASLDQLANGERAKGVDVGQAAIAAENAPANTVLNLEEQMKNLPADYLAKLASILFPAGQLGQQESGTTKGKSNTSGFSVSAKYGT